LETQLHEKNAEYFPENPFKCLAAFGEWIGYGLDGAGLACSKGL